MLLPSSGKFAAEVIDHDDHVRFESLAFLGKGQRIELRCILRLNDQQGVVAERFKCFEPVAHRIL